MIRKLLKRAVKSSQSCSQIQTPTFYVITAYSVLHSRQTYVKAIITQPSDPRGQAHSATVGKHSLIMSLKRNSLSRTIQATKTKEVFKINQLWPCYHALNNYFIRQKVTAVE